MKKLALVLIISLSTMVMGATNVGYIDIQEISAKYSRMESIQKRLIAKKSDMEKELGTDKKAIEKKEMQLMNVGAKPSDKDKKELEEMKKNFNKKAQSYEMKLMELQKTELENAKLEIEKACQSVAKAKKLDTIIDKAAVLYGAVNVTADVIKILEKNNK